MNKIKLENELKKHGFSSIDGFKYFLDQCFSKHADVDVNGRKCIELELQSMNLYKPEGEELTEDDIFDLSCELDDLYTNHYYLF